ncbi:unnamed protein product [Gongylonema pulchrum]|uniref:ZP domain-containing protein n=1 Tax=Gongylonema pulchrum TaxID=637853 RepID=A0A183DIY6_9BILA|nr:unnamed protein product [Gongylonema pulchrum]
MSVGFLSGIRCKLISREGLPVQMDFETCDLGLSECVKLEAEASAERTTPTTKKYGLPPGKQCLQTGIESDH